MIRRQSRVGVERSAIGPVAHVDTAPVQADRESLANAVEDQRRAANERLEPHRRVELGQFMTPWPVAALMASMFEPTDDVRLLDAGAGIGSLTAAFVQSALERPNRPRSIVATLYEVDPVMLEHLREVMQRCEHACRDVDVHFEARILDTDFITAGAEAVQPGLYGRRNTLPFTAAILNPPYRKLRSDSVERALLRGAGVEVSNLYAAFVGLGMKLLRDRGQLVAITPRSFCNGPYFRLFRRLLLGEGALRRVHVFESRDRAFSDDDVLQENIIVHLERGASRTDVDLSSSIAPGAAVVRRRVSADDVLRPSDPDFVIHVAISERDAEIAARSRRLPCTLGDLGIHVSTGRVVDFRARAHLRRDPASNTAPLIYPAHFEHGRITWPRVGGRKANAIYESEHTRSLLVPNAVYVLTKRFTSKEERRRVVAALFDPERLPADVECVGFENHLNYFHQSGVGLERSFAKGLCTFLNSTLVDVYFRQFNGHTQVNAHDLRSLRYPTRSTLRRLGLRIGDMLPQQADIDELVLKAIGAKNLDV